LSIMRAIFDSLARRKSLLNQVIVPTKTITGNLSKM
jgi:hypothetical protein